MFQGRECLFATLNFGLIKDHVIAALSRASGRLPLSAAFTTPRNLGRLVERQEVLTRDPPSAKLQDVNQHDGRLE
jgi:hypothetical protein